MSDDWTLTDERIAKLEARVAACPCPQSAYCPDEVSSLRFELHIVAAKVLADLRAARARLAEVEAVIDALAGHSDRVPLGEIKIYRDDAPTLFTDEDGSAMYVVTALERLKTKGTR